MNLLSQLGAEVSESGGKGTWSTLGPMLMTLEVYLVNSGVNVNDT